MAQDMAEVAHRMRLGAGASVGVFRQVGQGRAGRAQVVRGRQHQLGSALPGRDGDHIVQLDRLVRESREGGARGHHGHSSAHIAGQRLNILQRRQLDLLHLSGLRQLLQVQFGIAGNNRKEMRRALRLRHASAAF